MKNLKLATKISVIVICILTIGLAVLWKSMDGSVSSMMEKQILQNMNEAAEARSEIAQEYVEAAEAYLLGYGQSVVLKDALLNPQDAELVAKAQDYTKNYGSVNGNLENVYLANYESTVLVSFVEGPFKAVAGPGVWQQGCLEYRRDGISFYGETGGVYVLSYL